MIVMSLSSCSATSAPACDGDRPRPMHKYNGRPPEATGGTRTRGGRGIASTRQSRPDRDPPSRQPFADTPQKNAVGRDPAPSSAFSGPTVPCRDPGTVPEHASGSSREPALQRPGPVPKAASVPSPLPTSSPASGTAAPAGSGPGRDHAVYREPDPASRGEQWRTRPAAGILPSMKIYTQDRRRRRDRPLRWRAGAQGRSAHHGLR